MDFHYYIVKDSWTNGKESLKPGVEISRSPKQHIVNYENGEGPYSTLEELKRKSKIFKELAKKDPKRIQQILLEKNISTTKGFIYTKDQSYDIDFIETFTHIITGKVKNNDVTGIHFYDTSNIKILELLSKNDLTGVFKARIKYYNKRTKKWIEKRDASTFFPLDWDYHKLFHECDYANKNKIKDVASENLYSSKTISGIDVKIVVIKGKLKTIYPVI